MHSHCQSSTSPPPLLQQKFTFPAQVLCKHYIHTIQHASLFLRKDSRHTVQQTSQFLRKYYYNNNNNLTISLQILQQQQQPQQQVLLSLSSVDVSFFFSQSHLPFCFSIFNQQCRMRVLTVQNSNSVQTLPPLFLSVPIRSRLSYLSLSLSLST